MEISACTTAAWDLAARCRRKERRLRRAAGLVSALLHMALAIAAMWIGHAVSSTEARLAGNSPELLWTAPAAVPASAPAEAAVLVTPTTAQVDRQPFVAIQAARLRPTQPATPLPPPELPAGELWRRELHDAAPPTLPPPPAEIARRREPAFAAARAVPDLVPGHDFHAAAPRSAAPPAYPDEARRRGWQGRVVLRVHVSAAGQPTAIEVVESSGYPLLDAAAATAVRGWRFYPARRGETAVPSTLRVPVEFEL